MYCDFSSFSDCFTDIEVSMIKALDSFNFKLNMSLKRVTTQFLRIWTPVKHSVSLSIKVDDVEKMWPLLRNDSKVTTKTYPGD